MGIILWPLCLTNSSNPKYVDTQKPGETNCLGNSFPLVQVIWQSDFLYSWQNIDYQQDILSLLRYGGGPYMVVI